MPLSPPPSPPPHPQVTNVTLSNTKTFSCLSSSHVVFGLWWGDVWYSRGFTSQQTSSTPVSPRNASVLSGRRPILQFQNLPACSIWRHGRPSLLVMVKMAWTPVRKIINKLSWGSPQLFLGRLAIIWPSQVGKKFKRKTRTNYQPFWTSGARAIIIFMLWP